VVSRLRFSGLLTTGVVAVWLLATVLAPAAGRFIQNVRVAQAQGLDLGHAIGDSLPALVGQPTVEQTLGATVHAHRRIVAAPKRRYRAVIIPAHRRHSVAASSRRHPVSAPSIRRHRYIAVSVRPHITAASPHRKPPPSVVATQVRVFTVAAVMQVQVSMAAAAMQAQASTVGAPSALNERRGHQRPPWARRSIAVITGRPHRHGP